MADTIEVKGRASTLIQRSGYEPNRLRRAATRKWDRMGPNQVRVASSKQGQFYDVNLDLDTPCDCMDSQMRGRGCLHELKARMVCGDMGLVEALGQMLERAEKFNKENGVD